MRRLRIEDWLARHDRERRRIERLTAGLPRPYRRERPRDPEEARFLREHGTPEHLIGPDRGPA
ncbi:MAG TPA: hypothetical protein VLB86_03845 [Gaiellaceae bacterium]|nr:hypothetical protein [Gaiellaceae bacterium]